MFSPMNPMMTMSNFLFVTMPNTIAWGRQKGRGNAFKGCLVLALKENKMLRFDRGAMGKEGGVREKEKVRNTRRVTGRSEREEKSREGRNLKGKENKGRERERVGEIVGTAVYCRM